MRILLTTTSIIDMYLTPHRMRQLGPRLACSLLQEAGLEADFIDAMEITNSGRTTALPRELQYLKPLLHPLEKSPTSFFTGLKEFGPPPDKLTEKLLEKNPALIIVCCFAWAYAEDALRLVTALKEQKPGLAIAVAGAGASVLPRYFLDQADCVLTGEAESLLPRLIPFWKQGAFIPKEPIPGLCTREAGTPAKMCSEEKLQPAFSTLFPAKNRDYLSVSLSRGCPAACRFCSNFLTHGRPFRTAPLEKVEQAIQKIPRSERPLSVNFEDDNLIYDKEYFYQVIALFSRIRPQVSFTAENGIDYTRMAQKDLSRLVEAGFTQMNFSLGNISPTLLLQEERNVVLSKYETFLDELAKRNIPVITYFITGLKGDTPEQTMTNLLYLQDKPTRIGISPFYTVPGLPDFTDESLFLENPPGLCRGSSVYPWNKSLTTRQMITAFRIARAINFLKTDPELPHEKGLKASIIKDGIPYSLLRRGKEYALFTPPGLDPKMVEIFRKSLL